MRVAGVVLATALALALQTTLGRFFPTGVGVDLVLVVVVYAALSFGPVTGLLAGTIAGLTQDALSTGVIGIGGLAKTIVGFVTGIVGTQFIVAHPLSRFVVFLVAGLIHAAIFMGVYELLGLRDFGTPVGRVVAQSVANAVLGLLVFKVAESLPGAVDRRNAGAGFRR